MFNISCSSEGFFLERHPKLAPVSTFTDGIFLAGCCQGPKDIPDTVAQAGAAAAEALALIDAGYVELEPNTAYVRRGGLLRLQDLHRHVSVPRDLLRCRRSRKRGSTRCCARAAAPAWRRVRPAPCARTCSRTSRSSRRSRGC